MLEKLAAHGFRTLVHTEVSFQPLTILIGKNGAGKTTILDVVQLIGKFARGGATRAFGPPPWSLGWQRTKGIGTISTVDFTMVVSSQDKERYRYDLRLNERNQQVKVEEERLMRETTHAVLANYDFRAMPTSGTVLNPDTPSQWQDEIAEVSSIFRSFESYELNPTAIERGNDPKHNFVTRDGYGVAGYLAFLKDEVPARFAMVENCLKRFRPETESIEVWAPADELFWGLKDKGQAYPFPAVHLSWGDRQLVGLLCVLFSTPPGATIAIEEIDRGFHPSRYEAVIGLLSEAAYGGLVEAGKSSQIIITTHSPSFVNKLSDLLENICLVTRAAGGGTVAKPIAQAMKEKLGLDVADQPIGDMWEMGLFEDLLREAMA
jgi:predicted ATPase